MVLLITSSPRAPECAAAIMEATGEQVQVAGSAHDGCAALRRQEFAAVVLDESVYDTAPEKFDAVFRRTETAVPLVLNFGISSLNRVVVEVRAAILRSRRELIQVREAAAAQYRSELLESITGILLSSELALKERALPAAAQEKLRRVKQLAARMRSQIEAGT